MEKRKMHGQISRKDENVIGSEENYWCVKQLNVKGETMSPVACVKDAGIITEYKKVTGKWMGDTQDVPTNQLTVFQCTCYWPRPSLGNLYNETTQRKASWVLRTSLSLFQGHRVSVLVWRISRFVVILFTCIAACFIWIQGLVLNWN